MSLCLHDVCPCSRRSLRGFCAGSLWGQSFCTVPRKNAPHTKKMAKAVAIRLVLCIPRSAPNDILLFSTEFACFLKEYLHKFINLLRTLAPHVSIMKPIYTRDSLFFSSQHHLQLNSVHDWNMGARHPSCWENLQNVKPPTISWEFAARYI